MLSPIRMGEGALKRGLDAQVEFPEQTSQWEGSTSEALGGAPKADCSGSRAGNPTHMPTERAHVRWEAGTAHTFRAASFIIAEHWIQPWCPVLNG